jgi:competence protein ComGC
MPKAVRKPPLAAAAFTLVELLVVIGIIVLLVGILVPVVQSAIRSAEKARTEVWVADLGNGCGLYQNDYSFFPGQSQMDQIGEVSDGKKTGSQWLARALVLGPTQYAEFKADDLINFPGHKADGSGINLPESISDRTSEPMAVLYFPAKIGLAGMEQYDLDHNIEYVRENGDITSINFQKFLWDKKQPLTPYNPQGFILTAAGMDRRYLTADDIKGPGKW